MKTKRSCYTSLSLVLIITLVISLSGCQGSNQDSNSLLESSQLVKPQSSDTGASNQQTNVSEGWKLPDSAAVFASYQEIPVTLQPQIKSYRVAAGLQNIINKDQFQLSPRAEDLLIKNGFVVVPGPYREFFSSYESNRYEMIPNFVTTDAMLHNYHLYFDHLLRTLEKDSLRNELKLLTDSLLVQSQNQYQALRGTAWENASKRNVAFFAVAVRLLDPQTKVPSYVSQAVEQELRLIDTHQQVFVPSPVMNLGNNSTDLSQVLKEDYTQYIPRGHYTKSEDLKTYFQAMMWYGRMTFRVVNEDETKSAALITLLLSNQKDYEHWNNIYEPTNFFVGKSDDLGFMQYYNLFQETYGKLPALDKLTGDAVSWMNFRTKLEKLDPPAINSIPIFDETVQPDRVKEILGFRLMGQRFTLDASIFQDLIYRDVKENSSGERRMLPKGLDIPAATGSEEAYSILNAMGDTKYLKYPENMAKLKTTIAGLQPEAWNQNLYWSWLYTLAPLTEPKGKGYPSFMLNQAWTRKQLETYLGSWTELKHDTILYAKQVYAEMGGGMEEIDDRGYVEPNPVVYARLAALTGMTLKGLDSRGLLKDEDRDSLQRMEELALKLKAISEKEMTNRSLNDEENDLIRGFGGQLEHFWLEALSDEGVEHISASYENPAALVADVATDPNGLVLEEGTGLISDIYAVVPVDGKLRIAKGAVYSYYEFPWPAGDRLTDEKWKGMLETEQMPKQPDWTQVYTVTAP